MGTRVRTLASPTFLVAPRPSVRSWHVTQFKRIMAAATTTTTQLASFKVQTVEKLRDVGGGVVFTWGEGRAGALGHDQIDREGTCALPTRVRKLRAIQVSE